MPTSSASLSVDAAYASTETTPIAVRQSRIWAWCGIGAGLLGLVGFFLLANGLARTGALAAVEGSGFVTFLNGL